ncbi:MAG TPA: excisionase family DNA-binding protein [Armatimonadota bacterium]|jgi:excisionase family DNA binding protein
MGATLSKKVRKGQTYSTAPLHAFVALLPPSKSKSTVFVTVGRRSIELTPADQEQIRSAVAQIDKRTPRVATAYTPHLTTQQAANALNVSRQYLTRLLDEGAIPFYRVGNRRRLNPRDVLDYKRQRDGVRRQHLDELIEMDDEDGIYAREAEVFGQPSP